MLFINYLYTLSIPIVHHSFIIPISFLYPNPTLLTPFFHQKPFLPSSVLFRFLPNPPITPLTCLTRLKTPTPSFPLVVFLALLALLAFPSFPNFLILSFANFLIIFYFCTPKSNTLRSDVSNKSNP